MSSKLIVLKKQESSRKASTSALLTMPKPLTMWKGVSQGFILSPCLFNLYAENIMRNAGWKKHELESRLPGEIPITSDIQMTLSLWQKVKRK